MSELDLSSDFYWVLKKKFFLSTFADLRPPSLKGEILYNSYPFFFGTKKNFAGIDRFPPLLKRFCSFWGPHPLRNRCFSWYFSIWDLPRPCKPCFWSNFFLSLCTELSVCMHQGMHLLWVRKLVSSIFFWFFQPKFKLFPKKVTKSLRLNWLKFTPLDNSITQPAEAEAALRVMWDV